MAQEYAACDEPRALPSSRRAEKHGPRSAITCSPHTRHSVAALSLRSLVARISCALSQDLDPALLTGAIFGFFSVLVAEF